MRRSIREAIQIAQAADEAVISDEAVDSLGIIGTVVAITAFPRASLCNVTTGRKTRRGCHW